MEINLSSRKAFDYMLSEMTSHYLSMLRHSDDLYSFHYSFIVFCIGFLHRLGYCVLWDDVAKTYKILI